MKTFWKAAIIRAARTFCQTAVATISTSAVISEVNWGVVISSSLLSEILSILTSIATGLPEVEDTKTFWKAAIIRAVRTFCQTAAATIGTTALISEVNWAVVLSSSLLSGILSILTSVATGLPEAEEVK